MIPHVRQWMQKNRIHWFTLVVHAGVAIWYLAHAVLFFVEDPVDPVDWLTAFTGHTGINLLLLSLACTPLFIITRWSPITRVRRPLGLYGFTSVVLHFVIFIVLFHDFFWSDILSDILNRNIYRAGFAALVLMIPLAVTSTKGWQRRLRKNWGRLHKAMYVICFLAALHYIWVDKRPNLMDLVMAGEWSDIVGQMVTKSYFRMELIILLLVLRIPPIRKNIVSFRNRFRKPRKPRRPPARASTAA